MTGADKVAKQWGTGAQQPPPYAPPASPLDSPGSPGDAPRGARDGRQGTAPADAAAPGPSRPRSHDAPPALIELRNVHKRFGRLIVLDGVDLSVPAGQSLVVIGASGSGKSVMLKHIVGLLEPDEGEVWFDGRRIDDVSERELIPVRQQFGFLFQMGALFDSLTVEENVAFPLVEHTNKKPDEISRIVDEKLAMVGLPDTRKKMPAQLSGGQRKRIALARAIALHPRVILYDEPTTGLDPVRSDVINELILKLQREMDVTSIVVTHDMQSAFKVGNRIVMLHEGKLVFDGTPQEVQRSQVPTVRNFVLGEASEQELAALRRKRA